MVHSNFAGNIIVNLASLPDFLRRPILKKRMEEFFTLPKEDQLEVINNALEAGPTIPYSSFSKLFATWLEILADMEEQKRFELCSMYIYEILKNPQKLAAFNLDGILEIFLKMDPEKKSIISSSVKNIFSNVDQEGKRRLFLIIPNQARNHLGI